jgi:hypothetical protein
VDELVFELVVSLVGQLVFGLEVSSVVLLEDELVFGSEGLLVFELVVLLEDELGFG